ncbi:copper homeostasis protein CutC [Arenibacter sp. GZD96]|uniref:copper homeostasis protein CutC n=1 Tax=Aurantibrevibacter litoralis TaxID=3106030 RepID=UPI002AFF9A3A|nr:copper homeostasis protein CutC [Arenibacter sp. GZD-96]MEA1784575.1 copper homeostasis protein CutC [Arenibacter sp. GZD-96]
MLVEVCANSLESALNAQKAGADRIEICTELGVGGITPSSGLLQQIKAHISIPVHVLIRPRSGDFTYSDTEFNTMKADIEHCKALGFNGIVSGILHADFTLDAERTKALLALSHPLQFTFHRAFDWLKDPLETMLQLETMGVHTLLTSGQAASCVQGMELLCKLEERAKKITIMPGGGINPENALSFKEKGFKAIHLSGTRFKATLSSTPQISMNSIAHLRENAVAVTQREIIQNVLSSVK